MPMTLKTYCKNSYNKIFTKEYKKSIGKKTSQSAKDTAERYAQKEAIKNTFELALKKFPTEEPYKIWDQIYLAHVLRKSTLTSATVNTASIQNIVSAHQSWNKTSGHAFEAFIEEQVNPELKAQKTKIKFILQKQLTEMIKKNEIHNSTDDLDWLKQQCKKDVFDLFAIYSVNGDYYVFGCIQSKTSIRDRVSRDREPSLRAMELGFWSIAITLNGEFLSLPKFKDMVNGGGSGYKENGWNGMYVMSNDFIDDRIYSIRDDLSHLIDHAVEASKEWISNRKALKSDWKAS